MKASFTPLYPFSHPMIYYLLLGSNIPPREVYFQKAKQLLAENDIAVIEESALYETAAWGKTNQANFLNQALKVSSGKAPLELLATIKQIEAQAGRQQREHWGQREIDIDILLASCGIFEHETLSIPHPQLHLRRFALMPLAEIAPNEAHPVFQADVKTLLSSCEDNSIVVKL